VPRSIAEAMADGEILQIVVFSIFAGVACDHGAGERAKLVLEARRAALAR
jgi:Na+/H+-dicarboxylate symporter